MSMDRKALVIIDMVNDFVRPSGALAVPGADGCVPAIDKLRTAFHEGGGLVLFLCDAHHPRDPEFENWPPHSVRGTQGAQVVTELAPTPGDIVVPKCCIDTYEQPQFPWLLQCAGVEELLVTGVATEHCVLKTALGGLERGYRITVVTDGVKGVEAEEGDVAEAERAMRDAGCRLATAAEALGAE
ncbi:MAG: cysteine hydrolase family protein [Oceanidesulfovibrio sp.]